MILGFQGFCLEWGRVIKVAICQSKINEETRFDVIFQ